MSIEGRMMWLMRSSPVDVGTIFWSKYWVGTLPLLLVALPLIVGTNIVLDASRFILVLTTVTMVGITFALTALALGFGALYPNYDTENVAEIPTSFGGLLFMMTAVSYLAGVVILEGWPVYLFLDARLQGGDAKVTTTPLFLGIAGATVLTGLATWLPLRAGIRKVQSVDF
jgi:ABC-2 type transport system permease protein